MCTVLRFFAESYFQKTRLSRLGGMTGSKPSLDCKQMVTGVYAQFLPTKTFAALNLAFVNNFFAFAF